MGRTFGAAYAGVGVPYEIRTPVTAVKEKRFSVIQWNLAAWIALDRIWRTQARILDVYAHIGRLMDTRSLAVDFSDCSG